MATRFPTDTSTVTPTSSDLLLVADVSNSNAAGDATIQSVVDAVISDSDSVSE